ncbi:SUR7/PalI family-domain-containing protein [Xylariaceae sp. AK1471]|nr:SUR7/PalI family-domain-containing protein [Xylariaceae sp. AK1471]
MALGSLPRFRRRQNASNDTETDKESGNSSDAESKARLKRATKTRRNAIVVSSFFYLVAVVFLILVEIGNTRGSKTLETIYFFKLNLANILAQSAPTSLTLQNSIARTLGLHDFYQVGLWNFCEGYQTGGITHCSKPNASFWFNPVEILLNELLAGASIGLPADVNSILNILRIASHIMFAFFLAGIILNAVLLVVSPVVLYSRWWSLPIGILSFIAALLVVIAAILGTVISYVFEAALSSQPDLGVTASVGIKMLAFEWIAAGFTLLAFIIHAGLGCCCTSRRDIRTGRKGGNNVHQTANPAGHGRKGSKLPGFGKKSESDETSQPRMGAA